MSPTLTPGTRVGPYEIVALLGVGGMGEVYRASDTNLRRQVAIKVLPASIAANTDRLARFHREAEILAALNHPNIAHVFGLERQEVQGGRDGTFALVMELVEGPTLSDRIARGPIPLAEALPIARQICEAIEAAHDQGIIHRDLKPANIKVTPEGTVKVLDFGLAKALSNEAPVADPASSPTLTMRATMAGTIMGTAAYMAPEQVKGKPADRRSDIWAFGCVLAEMLTGKSLFPGEGISEILASVIKDQPDLAAVPAHLRPMVERCLRKDGRTRWQAIGDVRIALEEARPSALEPAAAPAAKRGMAAWCIAGAAILTAAGLAFVHFREQPAAVQPIRFQLRPPDKTAFGPAFALSPNGRTLAFVAADVQGRSFIWVRPLDALDAYPLPATEGSGFLPFWSPDSRYIVFAGGGKLKKVDATGGPAQAICDSPPIVIGGSWNADGTILFSGNEGAILKVPAAGGIAVPLTKLQAGETFHSHPFFLPDGRHFLYSRQSQTAGDSSVYIGLVDAKPEEQPVQKVVTAPYAIYAAGKDPNRGHLLFLRERTLMAQPFDAGHLRTENDPFPIADPVGQYVTRGLFSASQTGTLVYQSGTGAQVTLSWFNREGKPIGTPLGSGAYRSPAISPDGKWVAARFMDSRTGNQDIWLFDLARGSNTRFTFDPALEQAPVWSPDSARVAFTSSRSGMGDLYVRHASQVRPESLLLHGDRPKSPFSWSPDGRFLLYSETQPLVGLRYLEVPADGSTASTTAPFLASQFRASQAQFSPDGRWVAYTSEESSHAEVYVRPFPPPKDGGGQWMISNGGGTQPRWNRNGKELLYFSGRKMMSVEVTTGAQFHAGIPKPLFDSAIYAAAAVFTEPDWDISPDGQRFLITTEPNSSNNTPITVMVHWLEALRK
ncbi:MAG TPA: protein kinase [Candidatus Solibacter sp.]|nr:protein kinase [Candidatus Solibacter sp.]